MAEEQLALVRNVGDVMAGAFFAGDNRKSRRNALLLRQDKVRAAFGNPPDFAAGVALEEIAKKQRQLEKPIVPFHWELEFPEVFDLDQSLRPQSGFDAIVGNPPFAGRTPSSMVHPKAISTGSKRSMPSHMATRIWSRTSSAAPSMHCVQRLLWTNRHEHNRTR